VIAVTDIELLSKRARIKAAKAEAGLFERPSPERVRGSIDHTLLAAGASVEDVTALCDEAVRFGFASVCVPLSCVPDARRFLSGSAVKVSSVAAFPLGATPIPVKTAEVRWALENGADEVDAVVDIRAARALDRGALRDDLSALREASRGAVLKVILEMPLLNDVQAVTAVMLAEQAGVDFVKTCTGFAGGVTFYHGALLRTAASDRVRIQASGGIRTYAAAEILVALGADRLGTSKATQFLGPLDRNRVSEEP